MKQHERPVYVIMTCNGEKIDERKVEFIDVHEDIQGRDRLIFRCPECGGEHISYRLG